MLSRTHRTLDANWYYDPNQYRRELEAIWWNGWLCVTRETEIPVIGSYRLITVGDQQILITRTASGELQGFHNTCRHRGSLLCEATTGQFPQQRIVCPYHAWTYSLEGELIRTPRKSESSDFQPQSYSLYRIAVQTWGGFVFINLAQEPSTGLQDELGEETETLVNWPMAELQLAHQEIHTLNCNWKIFWENFLECYHCPNIHPDLCRLVPVYKEAVVTPDDLPDHHRLRVTASDSHLAAGAVTWSADGQTTLPWFPGLSLHEQAIGMTFSTLLPSVFIVAHVDYVRSVHVLPQGPEQTQLTVNWLLLPQTLASGKVDIPALTAFGHQVVLEDARICELNQKGLHSIRHHHGVLAPQEYDVLAFDNWVRARLGERAQE